jgi:hypothetical protein
MKAPSLLKQHPFELIIILSVAPVSIRSGIVGRKAMGNPPFLGFALLAAGRQTLPRPSLASARQGKARQGKARQGKARQGKARQGKARQGKARQGVAMEGGLAPPSRFSLSERILQAVAASRPDERFLVRRAVHRTTRLAP